MPLPSYYYGVKLNGATVDVVNDYPNLADFFPDGVLPNLMDRYIKCSNSAGEFGSAGVPDLYGGLGPVMGTTASSATGVFNKTSSVPAWFYNNVNTTITYDTFDFRASRVNSIYGKSTTVDTDNLTVIPFVCYQ